MSAARLRDLLKTGELFLTNLPALEDQYEGALTTRAREGLTNWFQLQNKSSRAAAYAEADKYQENRKDFYVNCWHMNENESYLMWKAYGDRGYAVHTTFERVQCAFETSNTAITGGVVQYVDFDRDLTPVGNVFNHVATKDTPYTDEREFRLVFWGVSSQNADIPKLANGVRVPVNVKMLVRTIVSSPFAAPMDAELERLIETHDIDLERSRVLPRIKTEPSSNVPNGAYLSPQAEACDAAGL